MPLERLLASLTLGTALAFGSMHCGPEPNGHPDACVSQCTTDGGSDASNDGSTDATADAPADVPCTITPSVNYDVTNLTPNGSPNTYTVHTNTPFTIDACDTTGAERFNIAWGWPTLPVAETCSATQSYTNPGTYTVTIGAFNDTCSTQDVKTLQVIVEQPNLLPIANAGPDMTLQANTIYCFNFSNSDQYVSQVCGNTPFAPGHSAQGTGSHAFDGKTVIKYFIQGDMNGRPWSGYNEGVFLSWFSPGQKTLQLKIKDSAGLESQIDEAIVTPQ